MDSIKKSPKIFFGWWTVIASGIIGFLAVGFGSSGFSVLFKPISAELNIDRAVTSIASGLQSSISGIIGLTGGWASDKYGPRRVMLMGIIFMVCGCVAMFFVNSVWSYVLAWGFAVGSGYYLGATFISDRAIANWFVKKSGIALSVKFAMQCLAGLLLLPVIALLVENYGWRNTCLIAAAIIAVVCIPLIWFFIKPQRPEYYGLRPDGAAQPAAGNQVANKAAAGISAADAAELSLKQTMKTSAYWLIIAIQFSSVFANTMMGAHFIPFLTDNGIDTVQAASMMGMLMTISIPVRIIAGLATDRLKDNHLQFLMASGIFLQGAGIIVFLIGQSTAAIYGWIFVYSVGSGISQTVTLPLQARYFGRKSFGAILGLSLALQMPLSLVVPSYVGWVYDNSHSYLSIIKLMAILSMASGIIACFIRRPKLPNPSGVSVTGRG